MSGLFKPEPLILTFTANGVKLQFFAKAPNKNSSKWGIRHRRVTHIFFHTILSGAKTRKNNTQHKTKTVESIPITAQFHSITLQKLWYDDDMGEGVTDRFRVTELTFKIRRDGEGLDDDNYFYHAFRNMRHSLPLFKEDGMIDYCRFTRETGASPFPPFPPPEKTIDTKKRALAHMAIILGRRRQSQRHRDFHK